MRLRESMTRALKAEETTAADHLPAPEAAVGSGGMSTGRFTARRRLAVGLATGASGTVGLGPTNADEPLSFVGTGKAGDWAGGGGVRAANSAAVAIPRGVAARAREGAGRPK